MGAMSAMEEGPKGHVKGWSPLYTVLQIFSTSLYLLTVIFFILRAFLFNGVGERMPVFSVSCLNIKLNIEKRRHL